MEGPKPRATLQVGEIHFVYYKMEVPNHKTENCSMSVCIYPFYILDFDLIVWDDDI